MGPPGCARSTDGENTISCDLAAGLLEVAADYAAVRALFPGAAVVASDLDAAMAGVAARKDQLPVVTGELAEGWICARTVVQGPVAALPQAWQRCL
jgi:hypothetical protein